MPHDVDLFNSQFTMTPHDVLGGIYLVRLRFAQSKARQLDVCVGHQTGELDVDVQVLRRGMEFGSRHA